MTLVQLFTAIANQIRRLKGTSGTIVAENFPTEMSEIELGKLTDEEYEISNDKLDEILEGSTPATIYPPDWSEIGYSETPQDILDDFDYSKEIYDNWDSSTTSLASRFSSDTTLKYMPLIDIGNVTSMQQCFNGCSNLLIIPLLNTEKVTTMQQCFAGCSSLKSIPQINTERITSAILMFNGCSNLENVPLLNLSRVTNMINMFNYCSKLSRDSLNNILAMCTNATSYSGTKTLKTIGISSAQATTCQSLSNYQAFLNAGWTTGY